jgi:hypothetical protein
MLYTIESTLGGFGDVLVEIFALPKACHSGSVGVKYLITDCTLQFCIVRLNRTVGTNAKCQTLFFRFGIPAIFPSHGRDKRQTPNTEYTIINAVNNILIVLGQICVL